MKLYYAEINKPFQFEDKKIMFVKVDGEFSEESNINCIDCIFDKEIVNCAMMCCCASERLDHQNTIVKECKSEKSKF